jgi:hypothetical protein
MYLSMPSDVAIISNPDTGSVNTAFIKLNGFETHIP